ncbi:MAG TPA: hypothetical protein VIZ65_09450 [Cellvibrionaceae bacterium]
MTTTKEWPDAVIKQITDSIAYNAPTRTLSTLLPFDSIKFGKDCIELHNSIIKTLYKDEKMKLGDRIVGASTATHTILKNQGLAGDLKIISFLTAEGKNATGNATANKLKESVGDYVKKYYSGSGVSIFGVSALDGYHSMLLTYRLTSDKKSEFMLIDQGPATSLISGKVIFSTSQALDDALSEYVRGRKDKRTGGNYEYPANISLYKIYPKASK